MLHLPCRRPPPPPPEVCVVAFARWRALTAHRFLFLKVVLVRSVFMVASATTIGPAQVITPTESDTPCRQHVRSEYFFLPLRGNGTVGCRRARGFSRQGAPKRGAFRVSLYCMTAYRTMPYHAVTIYSLPHRLDLSNATPTLHYATQRSATRPAAKKNAVAVPPH